MYKAGSFTNTHRLVKIGHKDNEYFTMDMETFDREQ